MKEMQVKVHLPESTREVTDFLKALWRKFDQVLDEVAQDIVDKLNEGDDAHGR